MSEAFVRIDLHGLRQEEAMKVIDKALGIIPGDNPGITVLVLKELY